MENSIITSIILCGLLLSLEVVMIRHQNKKQEKIYNETPLTAGTVVEKIDINTKNAKTMFLIDTDSNKDTIEKEMIIKKDSLKDIEIINAMDKGSKIKFKDKYEDSSLLLSKHIYQIDDLIINQK